MLLTSQGFGALGFLSVDRANAIMKAYYASELLYVSSLCFSKLSIVVLFYNVVVLRTHRMFVLSFGISIFLWSLASLTAAAFQCSFPRPWEMMTLRCFNMVGNDYLWQFRLRLTATANILGRVLCNRYVDRAVHRHALGGSSRTSQGPHVSKSRCRSLFCTTSNCRCSCSCSRSISVPSHATWKSRI